MKIICLGDSLTAGCGLRRGENWVELLREQTGDEWINAGVCGDTSTGILVRLQTEVLPQRPDEVLLMGGDNDIMLTGCADQAKSAMMAMIHQCAARGVKPVVGIQFPVLGIPEPWRAVCDWERAQAESAAYIAWLRRLVRAVSLRHVDFAEAFERCGVPFDEARMYHTGRYNYESGYTGMQEILKNTPEVTAVFAMADVIAIGAIRAACDAGKRVPEDISVIGYDGLKVGDYYCPKLSTIAQSLDRIALRSFEIIMACVENGAQARHITVPFTLSCKQSVRNLLKE